MRRLLAAALALLAADASAQSPTLQQLGGAAGRPLPEVVIYPARRILTLDPARPAAEAVAVVGRRIAGVGAVEELLAAVGAQRHRIDETFADLVLVPGFVEHHVHPLLTAATMTTAVIAIEDWDTVSGPAAAVRDEAEYYRRLQAAIDAHEGDETFITWGYHHYFHGDGMSLARLDEMAGDLPVIVWHRSAHEVFLNTAAMVRHGVDQAFLDGFSDYEAAQSDVARGHFYEMGAVKMLEKIGGALASPARLREGLEWSEDYYLSQGITTAAEPGGFYSKALQDMVNAVYADDATPFNHYFIPDGKSLVALEDDDQDVLDLTRETTGWGEGRARFLSDQVKLFADGAIYSQLMQMRDGYTDGHDGEWIMYPAEFARAFRIYWEAGYTIGVHVNGDAGLDVVLDQLELAQRRRPRFDHRMHVIHFGYAAPDQIDRAARLGALISANPYYVTALSTRYAQLGLGPARAARIVPLGEAATAGIPISLHSDMPMAPADPLKLIWAAATRKTAEGPVAGPELTIDVETALRGVTIEGARVLRLEREIGSIERGKLANFTVLGADPVSVALDDLPDIPIWGTVLEGRLQPAPAATASDRAEAPPSSAPLRFGDDDGGRRRLRADLAWSRIARDQDPAHAPQFLAALARTLSSDPAD